MTMKSESDLHRAYADIIDMCRGTGAIPRECVKLHGHIQQHELVFNSGAQNYEFAIGILEGKGVFRGDTIYTTDGDDLVVHKIDGEFAIRSGIGRNAYRLTKCTWKKPPESPYAPFIAAKKAGKRLGFTATNNIWGAHMGFVIADYGTTSPESFRIIPDDEVYWVVLGNSKVKIVKSAIDGSFYVGDSICHA